MSASETSTELVAVAVEFCRGLVPLVLRAVARLEALDGRHVDAGSGTARAAAPRDELLRRRAEAAIRRIPEHVLRRLAGGGS